MSTLLQRLEADREIRVLEVYASRNVACTLGDKFDIANLSMWAETLGLCRLVPGVAYTIKKLERQSTDVLVHFADPLRTYRLPPHYARIVSDMDITIVNWGFREYELIRTKNPSIWFAAYLSTKIRMRGIWY
jgi:hypothetical protein